MNDEVTQGIVGTFTILFEGQWIVLEKTQGRPKHNRKLPKTNSFKDPRFLIKGLIVGSFIRSCRKSHICIHLRGIRKVAHACFHQQHWLDTTGCFLDAWFHVTHLFKRQPELVLVFLDRRFLFVPNGNRRGGLDDERKLIANKIFKRINLMIYQTSHSIHEIGAHCFPFSSSSNCLHGATMLPIVCK